MPSLKSLLIRALYATDPSLVRTTADETPRERGGLDMSLYSSLRPRYDMCEISHHAAVVDGDNLWIHGGIAGYDNGTRISGPNHMLRKISFTKSFPLASREEAPVTYISVPTTVPESSQGSLWVRNGELFELPGEAIGKDAPLIPNEMQVYTFPENVWNTRPLSMQSGGQLRSFNITGRHYDMHVPKLGKAYVFGGHAFSAADKDPMRRALVYSFAQKTWTPLQREFRILFAGTTVYLPIGPRGIIILIGGHRERQGDTALGGSAMTNVDMFNLNNNADVANPEGTWSTHIATAANPSDGVPPPRFNTCAWVVYAPDGSSAHIYVYGGQEVAPTDQEYYQDLWVLTIPSLQWIKLDDGAGLPIPKFNQTRPGQREGHTCHLIRKSTVIMFGGRIQPPNSRACETTGLYAFDLNKQEWMEEYDVDKADEEYKVPENIYKVIGGGARGGATKAAVNAVPDDSLKPLFEEMRNKGLAATSDLNSASPPDVDEEDTEPRKGLSTASVLGIVFGVLFAIPASVAIFYFLRGKFGFGNKKRNKSSTKGEDEENMKFNQIQVLRSQSSTSSKWSQTPAELELHIAPNKRHEIDGNTWRGYQLQAEGPYEMPINYPQHCSRF